MEKGKKFSIERTVTNEMTARVMGSGTLDVLATPAMIALIEETAWRVLPTCWKRDRPPWAPT